MQGTDLLAGFQSTVRRLGPLARTLDIRGDDGVEFGVIGFDTLQIEVEQFEAADLLLPDRGSELLGGLEREGEGHVGDSVRAMVETLARTILSRPA